MAYKVEVFDDSIGSWTSSTTNVLYAALLKDDTPTVHPNNVPAVKIWPSNYFTEVRTVQVRVSYTSLYSQNTSGANQIIDQFAVTVYPSPYKELCAGVTLDQTNIADFTLDLKHAAGASFSSDKTFAVTKNNLGSCASSL